MRFRDKKCFTTVSQIRVCLLLVVVTVWLTLGCSCSFGESLAQDIVAVPFSNCGVNSFLSAAVVAADPEILEREFASCLEALNSGVKGEHLVNMLDLQSAFSILDIETFGVKVENGSSIPSIIGYCKCAILHSEPRLGQGHFVCVYKEGDNAILVDYPRIERVKLEDLPGKLADDFSGKVLLVGPDKGLIESVIQPVDGNLTEATNSDGEAKSLGGEAREIADSRIFPQVVYVSAEDEYSDTAELILEVVPRRKSGESISIKQIVGSCSCFLSDSKNTTKPGHFVADGSLFIAFDKKRFPWNGTTSVAVKYSSVTEIIQVLPRKSAGVAVIPKIGRLGNVKLIENGGVIHYSFTLVIEQDYYDSGDWENGLWIREVGSDLDLKYSVRGAARIDIAGKSFMRLNIDLPILGRTDPFIAYFVGGVADGILFDFEVIGIIFNSSEDA